MTVPSTTPFFVVGSQRSGTTMLRLMLNKHPDLCVPHESGFIVEQARQADRFGDLAQADNRARLVDAIAAHRFVVAGKLLPDRDAVLAEPAASYAEVVDAIFRCYARARGKRRWGDKTPDYGQDIGVLWSLFPGAQFIHVVRDGRDVALSLRTLSWGSRNMIGLARDWAWKTIVPHKVGAALGPRHYMEIRYEDLVREPEAGLRRICAFLGERYDPAMLSYAEDAAKEVPAGSLQWHRTSVSPPDKARAEAWRTRMSVADRAIFEEHAAEALALFGYELERHPPSWGTRLRKLRYLLVNRW